MSRLNAIIFITDGRGNDGVPMYMENMLFRPLAAWVYDSLRRAGVERFFLICGAGSSEGVVKCFPEGTPVVNAETYAPEIELHSFLGIQPDGSYTLIVTRPVYILDRDIPVLADIPEKSAERPLFRFDADKRISASGINRIGTEILMEELRSGGGFDLAKAIREAGIPMCEGSIPIRNLLDLHLAQEAAKQDLADRLIKNDVRFIDKSAAYICLDATIGAGTLIMPGTVISGMCEIGENCVIGPNTYLENARVERGARISASHVYNSKIWEGAEIGPFAVVRPGSQNKLPPEPAVDNRRKKR